MYKQTINALIIWEIKAVTTYLFEYYLSHTQVYIVMDALF